MNPMAFMEVLGDLPDEFIESAAEPHSRPVLRPILSAAAAGFVLLTAAAVYPKLRAKKPEISEPPAAAAETTGLQTAFSAAQTTETEGTDKPETKQTSGETKTTASSAKSGIAETASETTRTPEPSAETEPPKTAATVSEERTDLPEVTEETETTISGVPISAPEKLISVTVPVWSGEKDYPESCPPEFTPTISAKFSLCSADEDGFLHELFGIPAEYDLTQHPCLLIELEAFFYEDAAVIGGELMDGELHLKIAGLRSSQSVNAFVRYALPVPEGFVIKPENCTAEYLTVTEESEYQALVTDSLTIEIEEQEGLP